MSCTPEPAHWSAVTLILKLDVQYQSLTRIVDSKVVSVTFHIL